MVEAALDGEFAETVELCKLGGREAIAVVARDERALLHAEVNCIVVHHKAVAHIPAEVAVSARGRVAVLQLGCRVE